MWPLKKLISKLYPVELPYGDPRRSARQAEKGAAREEKAVRLIEELAKEVPNRSGARDQQGR